jgi:PAS domain S-box-containing protein
MKEMDELQDELLLLLHELPGERGDRLEETVERLKHAVTLLEERYDRTLRHQAVVNTLLRNSSEELAQRYQTIFEHSGTAMAVIDETGLITLVNSNCERLLGYPRAEIENRMNFLPFLDEGTRDDVLEYRRRRLLDHDPGVPSEYETRIVDRFGTVRNVSFTIGHFPGTGEIIVSIVDVDERKCAQKAVEIAQRKITILNQLTRHDINNQLTPLFLRIEEAMAGSESPELKELLGQIERIGINIRNQIEFMSLYHDIGIRSPTWQDVAEVVRTVSTSLEIAPVVLEVELGGLQVYADPLLQKVFYNLIENALRHGERVTRVRFSCVKTPTGVMIICLDDGVGVPAGEKEHIFEGVYYHHTGCGMLLSREILSITGISIVENGTPGEGARFEIDVPREACRYR